MIMNKIINTVKQVGQAKFLQRKDNFLGNAQLSKDLQFCKRSNKRQRPDSPTRTPGWGRNGYKRPYLHKELFVKANMKERMELRNEGKDLSQNALTVKDFICKESKKRMLKSIRKGHNWIKGRFFLRTTQDEIAQGTGLTKHQARRALDQIEAVGVLVVAQINESSRDQTRGYYIEGFEQWERANKLQKQKSKKGGNSSVNKSSKKFAHVDIKKKILNNIFYKYNAHKVLHRKKLNLSSWEMAVLINSIGSDYQELLKQAFEKGFLIEDHDKGFTFDKLSKLTLEELWLNVIIAILRVKYGNDLHGAANKLLQEQQLKQQANQNRIKNETTIAKKLIDKALKQGHIIDDFASIGEIDPEEGARITKGLWSSSYTDDDKTIIGRIISGFLPRLGIPKRDLAAVFKRILHSLKLSEDMTSRLFVRFKSAYGLRLY